MSYLLFLKNCDYDKDRKTCDNIIYIYFKLIIITIIVDGTSTSVT